MAAEAQSSSSVLVRLGVKKEDGSVIVKDLSTGDRLQFVRLKVQRQACLYGMVQKRLFFP
jgi:hypothetical protein